MCRDHGRDRTVQLIKSFGHRCFCIGLYFAIGDMAKPRSLGTDHAPAGAAERRIKAED
jgi:hypothetical protein